MRAMLLRESGPIETAPLEAAELADPEPGERELLVRVSVCGACRTDLHEVEGDLRPERRPVVPGHQVVGQVERTGPGCERFAPGDRVGIAWLRRTCGRCRFCRSGRENLCPRSRYTGHHADGGFAELAVVHEDFAYAVPDAFSDEDAAPLLCAGIIGYRALRRTELPECGRLALYGFGSSAHIVLQLALHRGHEVYVMSRTASSRELAGRMGASWAGEVEAAPPEPVDGAIVFAPAGAVVPPALRALGPAGTCTLAGIHMSPIPELTYEEHLFHEKTLRSVEANTRRDGRELLTEAAAVPVRPHTTAYPLEEANETLLRMKRSRVDGTAVLRVGPPSRERSGAGTPAAGPRGGG